MLKLNCNFLFLITIIIIIILLFCCVNYKNYFSNENKIISNKNKTLVLFVFHNYNERVNNFINNCIFFDNNIDFIIISNNKNITFDYPKYVKILFRDNIGYDFGGWSDALLTNNLYKKYNKFIFTNSSIIGPFLPNNFKGKWTDIYLNGLKNNIKLFGTTIYAGDDPLNEAHVQSYVFSMDINTLSYLIEQKIFSKNNYAKTFNDAVFNKEILMSRKILKKNWNIGSLLKIYDNVDFTFKTKKPKDYNIKFYGDVMFNKFKDILWKPEEIVFTKGNRDIIN